MLLSVKSIYYHYDIFIAAGRCRDGKSGCLCFSMHFFEGKFGKAEVMSVFGIGLVPETARIQNSMHIVLYIVSSIGIIVLGRFLAYLVMCR